MKTCATFMSLMALAALAAVGVSACSPAAPATPTWVDDIHPLLKAKCIRCHNTPGGGDPLVPLKPAVAASGGAAATQSFDYPDVASIPTSVLGTLALAGEVVDKGSAFLKTAVGAPYFMPPFPAEPLADWEIQTLQNWVKEGPSFK
jgi:hypothetical protein